MRTAHVSEKDLKSLRRAVPELVDRHGVQWLTVTPPIGAPGRDPIDERVKQSDQTTDGLASAVVRSASRSIIPGRG